MSSFGTSNTPRQPTHYYFTRLSSKRKLEEIESSALASRRIRKSSSANSRAKLVSDHQIESSSSSSSSSSNNGGNGGDHAIRVQSDKLNAEFTNSPLQFFVRMISGGKTLVLRAKYEDTVKMVHKRIEEMTGIPLMEQGLIYGGKQLQWDHTLKDCRIDKDAGLQLVGRMRSTDHPWAWRVISDLVSIICDISRKDFRFNDPCLVKIKLDQFMAALPLDKRPIVIKTARNDQNHNDNKEKELPDSDDDEDEDEDDDPRSNGNINKRDYCRIFMDASAHQSLIMLYMSKEIQNSKCADQCIRSFVGFLKDLEGCKKDKAYCVTMVLEFCKLLKAMVTEEDLLYKHCRSTLGSMLGKNALMRGNRRSRFSVPPERERNGVAITDVFPYLKEIGQKLIKDLELSAKSETRTGPLYQDVSDFSAFLQPLSIFIGKELSAAAKYSSCKGKTVTLADEADHLLFIFNELLCLIDKCLQVVELRLDLAKKNVKIDTIGWTQYLAILKELHSISLLYPGAEDKFWTTMRQYKTGVRGLVARYAMHADDHSWLYKCKDVLDFESRRHLALLFFPDVKEEYGELHEMLIDRSNLLAESFEYISGAAVASLHSGLFMEFKNEEATGPGVLREWFCLVTQAIFDPRNALFVSCPLDRRRFFPNSASKVHPLHLRYFQFSGRVIALALMHKIQVGVVLDRVFHLQLAGRLISLEDIRDADPRIYNSCKQILEMDAAFVDSDGLGLTFVTEAGELGERNVVELCPGGKDIAVNSGNRKEYVDLIVKHHFVTSISEQVYNFAKGFSEILSEGKRRETFFEGLELEDFDWMLHGSESEICVEDWKSHTEYNDYTISDPQIVWFWEVVGELDAEQKKTLLFFWTSVKYLPFEGFRGLASQLHIYKSFDSQDCLPTSHTCFYRLCIPQYPSKAVMRERILFITQEHVGCSFGTW